MNEASLCNAIRKVQNEQALSPQSTPSNVDTPRVDKQDWLDFDCDEEKDKAHHGRMLLTMSMQQPPKSEQCNLEDSEQKDNVWPASVGGILLMLSPLLIL